MLHRKRGERTQKGNPHQLTREQHVLPVATLNRFAHPDGLVEVHLRDNRTVKLLVDNQLFCVDRMWDQRAEAGYMKKIEDNFQALVTDLEDGRVGPLSPTEHQAITRFWSLLHWRNHFIESPADVPVLKGIAGENLTIDQREILESQWAAFADADNKLPTRMFVGMRIQMLIDIDAIQTQEKRWGVLRSPEAQLILSDKRGQPFQILAGVAGDFAHCGQVYAVGLRNIEDVGITESQQNALVLLGNILLCLLFFLAPNADNRSKNANAFLSSLHRAA